MESGDKALTIIICCVIGALTIAGVANLVTDTFITRAAISAGLVQDTHGYWVKPAPLPGLEKQ